MARTCHRPQNRLMEEIEQGIQDYEADERERSCRRRCGRLIEILTGESRSAGIFYRPLRPAPAVGGFLGSRTIGRPALWC